MSAATLRFASSSGASQRRRRSTLNLAPNVWNPADPVSGFAAIPRNMTGIATKMKLANYKTHQVGKWCAAFSSRRRLWLWLWLGLWVCQPGPRSGSCSLRSSPSPLSLVFSACLPLALSAADARMAGQRDAGMATVDHTPHGRGYDTSFGYFHHGPPLPHAILCRTFSL